ncbi:MAG TPA: biotin/lipoyl-containing protein, partial [Gaiellaceae bacterium]|nr:biotin/lipoyl-containing protein [Gaiellaceae bacterium]
MSTGTETQVVMPQMGVSVSEGTITKWLKQQGENVALDEPLLEISTDKVDTEVPSPGEGVVAQILHQEGETVEVGTVLAVIAPAGAAPSPAVEAPPEPATQEAADEAMASSSSGEGMTPAPDAPAPSA